MVKTLKNFGHTLLGLFLIGGFTTVGLLHTASNVFAQTPSGVPFANPDSTAGINVGGAGTDTGDNLLTVIKRFINYALGLLGLIALIMLLFGGYKMVTSAGKEDAYKSGVTILKNAAIGLAFIAVSWFLVQFIFYIIGLIA